MLPGLSFVLGGARSGKSAFAESLLGSTGKQKVKTYVATAQAFDSEMKQRIAAHRAQRDGTWRTIDAPHALADVIADRAAEDLVLVDCATLWLTNRMLAEADLDTETDALMQAIAACPARLVIVSNEVGQGIVPDNALARRFRDAQGRLNQRLAAAADLAVLVVAGLPMVLKGKLP